MPPLRGFAKACMRVRAQPARRGTSSPRGCAVTTAALALEGPALGAAPSSQPATPRSAESGAMSS
eukprot:3840146-Pyramimonas_sp.AAC.1